MAGKSAEAMGGEKRRTRVTRLMFAALGPAAAWFLCFLVLYPLAILACKAGVALPMHLAVIAGAVAIMLGGWAGWRGWRWTAGAFQWETADAESPQDPGPAELERTGFLSIVSMTSTTFFLLLLLSQWASTWILPPCLA